MAPRPAHRIRLLEDWHRAAAIGSFAFRDLWAVNDMTTELHNGLGNGLGVPVETAINHSLTGNTSNLIGVFGNNMLFCVPLSGPDAGQICPVAIGPLRCEMTGPTFVGDTLIISVQHPGEDTPIGTGLSDSRSIEMLNLNGTTFSQNRTVPRGSNWPSNVEGVLLGPPRPATIGITRKKNKK